MNTCIFITNYHWTKISPVVPHWGAIYNTQGCRELNTFFNISVKILFSKCHQTLKKIAMRVPLGAANYIFVFCIVPLA